MDKVFVVSIKYLHIQSEFSVTGVYDSLESAILENRDLSGLNESDFDCDYVEVGNKDKLYRVYLKSILSLDNMFKFSENAKPRKLLHIKRLIHKYIEGFREFEGFLVSTEFDNLLYEAQQDAKQIVNIIDMMLEPIEGE